MTAGVLHADLIALADQSDAARERLIEAAGRVTEIEHLLAAGAIEADAGSEYDLLLFFALTDLAALEAFGTDERYTRFLQQDVAANLRAFAGADVSIDAGLPPMTGRAACISLAAPDQTYDWEVRAALEAWCIAGGGKATLGLAAGERQRFRGLALVAGDAVTAGEAPGGRFGATIVSGKARPLP